MGYLSAMDFAMHADLDTTLSWHLQANLFPPVPLDMIEPAKLAIEAAIDEDIERQITLPPGRGIESVSASRVISALHLDGIIDGILASEEEE